MVNSQVLEEIKEVNPEEEKSPRETKTISKKKDTYLEEFKSINSLTRRKIKKQAEELLESHPILNKFDRTQVMTTDKHVDKQLAMMELLALNEKLTNQEKDLVRE